MLNQRLQNGKYKVSGTELFVTLFVWDGLFCTLEAAKKHFSDGFMKKLESVKPNSWRIILMKSENGDETCYYVPKWVDFEDFKDRFIYVGSE